MHTSALEVFFHIMRYINLHITLHYITLHIYTYTEHSISLVVNHAYPTKIT